MQKRIYLEKLAVPRADHSRGLELKEILNPDHNVRYGGVTQYLAIDCEMDHVRPEFYAG